jgi:membrane-associated phospholipid phosphatase
LVSLAVALALLTEPAEPAEDPDITPPASVERKQNLTPTPAEPPPASIRFTADPVLDGGLIIIGATFGVLSTAILSTDEIRPQQISPTFDASRLLGIDRGAIRQTPNATAGTLSNFGLWSAMAYAVVDTALDGFREGRSAALVDAIMYIEAGLVTHSVTNIAKVAFRRPRPRAYFEREAYLRRGGDPAAYDNSRVDSSLSFVSGHASQTAALAAAATYIAFSRSPRSPRPWITLAAGLALTTFVGWGRVRSAAHFPTDVIAGATIGTGIGALVVHLHREDAVKQRPVWIGITPVLDGAMATASGLF